MHRIRYFQVPFYMTVTISNRPQTVSKGRGKYSLSPLWLDLLYLATNYMQAFFTLKTANLSQPPKIRYFYICRV